MPTSEHRWGLQDERQYHNRVYVGQITGVREDDGIITVRLTSGAIHKMPIPVYGFSPAVLDGDGNTLRPGTQASWIRYMPQAGDYVKVAFGPDNRPEAIAAATWGDLPSERGPQGQLGGYAQISRARDRGVAGLETFYRLREGEWDMRSKGNAYIFGGRFGTLLLAGGGVQMRLQKEQEELNIRAGLTTLDSTGASFKLGDVKRQLPAQFQPTTVPGSAKELDLVVSQQASPSPTPPNAFYRLQAGDIRDGAGVIETGVSAPLRLRETVLDGLAQTGQPVPLVREVDAAGNITEVQAEGATVNSVTGSSVAEYSRTNYLSMTFEAATSVTLSSARVNLGSANAAQQVPRGNDLVAQIQALTVSTSLGPSGTPINAAAFPGTLSAVTFTD